MNHLHITEKMFSRCIDENTKDAIPFNKINYTAIVALELLGINAPSQAQIDILETFLTFMNSNVMSNPQNSKDQNNFDGIAKQLFSGQFASPKH